MNEPVSFIEYCDAVDAAMLKLFAIDTRDAGIELDQLAAAQEADWSATDFAEWYGDKYDLIPLS